MPEGKAWVAKAQNIARTEIKKQNWKLSEGEKLVAEVLVFFPDRRRRDVENLGKLMWDALEGIIYKDDRWLLPRYMDFSVDRENPRVELLIYQKLPSIEEIDVSQFDVEGFAC